MADTTAKQQNYATELVVLAEETVVLFGRWAAADKEWVELGYPSGLTDEAMLGDLAHVTVAKLGNAITAYRALYVVYDDQAINLLALKP